MDFEIEAFLPSQQQVMDRFGLNANGNTQRVVDTSFIHHMRLKMPYNNGVMVANTRNPEGGLVTVETPYAHYMNEGIKYVDPITGKGAFLTKTMAFGVDQIPRKYQVEIHCNTMADLIVGPILLKEQQVKILTIFLKKLKRRLIDYD